VREAERGEEKMRVALARIRVKMRELSLIYIYI
jgi:hypothetical protein